MSHRILIADDDQDDRLLMEMAFGELGFSGDIFLVNNGLEVLDYLDAIALDLHLPSLIVLDLNMPLLNGKETLLQLKNNIRYKNIAVIIHSTTKNEKERASCFELGAVDFLMKSSNFEQYLYNARYLYECSIVVTCR